MQGCRWQSGGFQKVGSRNSCEIDAFWSRITNSIEESYDLMVLTGIIHSCPTFDLARSISGQSNFLSLLLARGQLFRSYLAGR